MGKPIERFLWLLLLQDVVVEVLLLPRDSTEVKLDLFKEFALADNGLDLLMIVLPPPMT